MTKVVSYFTKKQYISSLGPKHTINTIEPKPAAIASSSSLIGIFAVALYSGTFVNAFAFLLSLYDKAIAKGKVRALQRVPEASFALVALLGGGLGLAVSFVVFNHKVRKGKFLLRVGVAVLVRFVFCYLFL